jgi:hypothetical protein
MLLTGKGLVEFAKTKLGTPYVYGMKGSILTKDKFATLQKTYGINYVWETDANKIGKVCCDCSGLISWYTNKLYGSSDLYNRASERHPISSIGDAPIGALVWKSGHVGVYIGYENGVPMYIAEDGSAYGCRKNKLSNAKFTHWLLMPFINYDMTSAKNFVATNPSVSYMGHAQSYGDLKIVKDGQICGTTGKKKRLEALSVVGLENLGGVAVVGQAHIQTEGWQKEIIFNGSNFIGSKGKAKRLEAIKLKLIGDASKYKIAYRTHVSNIGWTNWVYDWEMSGTVGKALAIEAVEIKIVSK